MLTSDATRTAVLDAVSSGADEYIIKTSFTKKNFCETLKKLLDESENSEQCSDSDFSRPDFNGSVQYKQRNEEAKRDSSRTVSVTPESSHQLNISDGNDDESLLQKMIHYCPVKDFEKRFK